MQKQRRLQQPGDDVGPIDNPIEVVQFAGVMEGIEDERDEAEDVKVRALGRSPAPEQNVDADAEIDQRDEPQPRVERAIGGYENDGSVEWYTLPNQRILGFGPDANAIELLLQAADIGDVPVIERDHAVARLDAGLLPGAVDLHALR